MTNTQFIYKVVLFYVVIIVLLSIFGTTTATQEKIIQFPGYPSIESLQNLGTVGSIISFILSFIPYLILVFAFIIRVVKFSLVDFLPAWINTIIFLPLGIIVTYEVLARLIRGS